MTSRNDIDRRGFLSFAGKGLGLAALTSATACFLVYKFVWFVFKF